MLRTNLATRPFYNERAAHLLLATVGAVAIATMIWSAAEVVALSGMHTQLAVRADQAEQSAAEVSARAAAIRRGLNQKEIEALTAAAEEANRLIDRRVFSWTQFFNRIERTLPESIMLTSVRPDFRADDPDVIMGVMAKSVEDIDIFIEQLESTGAFADVLSREEEITDEGMYRATLRGRYLGGAADDTADPVAAEPTKDDTPR
jgi:hypothetical protein